VKKLLVVGAAGQIVIHAEDRRVYEAKKYVILKELPEEVEVTPLDSSGAIKVTVERKTIKPKKNSGIAKDNQLISPSAKKNHNVASRPVWTSRRPSKCVLPR